MGLCNISDTISWRILCAPIFISLVFTHCIIYNSFSTTCKSILGISVTKKMDALRLHLHLFA